jgi:hypothetical protein
MSGAVIAPEPPDGVQQELDNQIHQSRSYKNWAILREFAPPKLRSVYVFGFAFQNRLHIALSVQYPYNPENVPIRQVVDSDFLESAPWPRPQPDKRFVKQSLRCARIWHPEQLRDSRLK